MFCPHQLFLTPLSRVFSSSGSLLLIPYPHSQLKPKEVTCEVG